MTPPVDTRRGRPRDPRADERILQAAVNLVLERGMDRMTMDDIAEAAGVGKATVYRRWPSKDELAIDALARLFEAQIPVPDTGSLRGDLERVYVDTLAFANTATGLAFIRVGISEACRDARIADLYRRSMERRRELARPVFERAIARGEVSAEINIDLVVDWLPGLLIYRAATGDALPNAADVPALVNFALRGVLTRDG